MSFPAPLTRELLKLFQRITSQNCSCRQKLQKYITLKRLNSPYLFVTLRGLVLAVQSEAPKIICPNMES